MSTAEKTTFYCGLVIVGFLTVISILYKLFGDVGVDVFVVGLVLTGVYCVVKAME